MEFQFCNSITSLMKYWFLKNEIWISFRYFKILVILWAGCLQFVSSLTGGTSTFLKLFLPNCIEMNEMNNASIQLVNSTVPVILHEYFHNNYYKYFIGLSFILIFAIVFNLIYLIIDSLLDKEKHYKLAMKVAGKYVAAKKQREQQKNAKRVVVDAERGTKDNLELDKVDNFFAYFAR